MVFGHSLLFPSPDLSEDAARRLYIPDKPQPAFMKSSLLIRRISFFKVGDFDTSWQVGDFVDWFAKSMEAGLKSHMLPDILFKRRVHGRNMTILERSSQGDFVRIFKGCFGSHAPGRLSAGPDSNNEPSFLKAPSLCPNSNRKPAMSGRHLNNSGCCAQRFCRARQALWDEWVAWRDIDHWFRLLQAYSLLYQNLKRLGVEHEFGRVQGYTAEPGMKTRWHCTGYPVYRTYSMHPEYQLDPQRAARNSILQGSRSQGQWPILMYWCQ
jgi:hypothetical protein